jgi:2-methylcitrate dehydratase PrpD
MKAAASSRQGAAATGLTMALAERAVAVRHDRLPAEIRALARQCILDWFAVTLAGADEELTRILAAEAQEQGGAAQASLVGHKGRTSTQLAALVNGAASHALDYDDVNMSMTGHPTAPVVSAVLALAEARQMSGADLVTAFVAGYETECRLGAAMIGHYARGYHSTATMGSVGAAAGCARLLGLDARQTATAMGIAATQAAGLKSMFGTMCKPFHAGKAAQNGLLAATLAARGFTSRTDGLECDQGFGPTLSPEFRPERALAEPKGGWHLRNNLFKYHAACYLTHAPIEAARAIRDEEGFDADKIAAATLTVEPGSARVCHILAPTTGLEAKFSLKLTTALALAGIDTAALESYSEANAADPRLVALRDKVTVEFPADWPHTLAQLEVRLADGHRFTAKHDSGIPAADIAQQGRRVAAKFMSLAEPVIGGAAAGELAQLVNALDRQPTLNDLTRLCQP